MNTEPEPSTETGESLPAVVTATGSVGLRQVPLPTPTDDQVTSLQNELVGERDGRRSERWGWSAAVGALLVMLAFTISGACGATIALAYVAWLIIFGRICGVEGIEQALAFSSRLLKPTKDDEKPTDDS